MESGFVQLRRGILEHLPSRMTLEEYSIYTLIILKADHRTGVWKGCALALARLTGKSERWCQYRLAALRGKGYVSATPPRRGQYLIQVNRYLSWAHPVSPKRPLGAPSVTQRPRVSHPVSPYQEVREQEEVLQEVRRPKRVRVDDDYPVLKMLS